MAQLHAIDPAILLEVVRADQRSSAFQITDWSVRSLSNQGVANPTGLWLFSGQGYDERGERPWAVVLKILTRQEPEPPPGELWYWKREYRVAQSGLTPRLATYVKAPRFYRTEETDTGRGFGWNLCKTCDRVRGVWTTMPLLPANWGGGLNGRDFSPFWNWGCPFPSLIATWCTPERHAIALQVFGAAEEDLFWLWLPLFTYILECADEARQLMHKLGKG